MSELKWSWVYYPYLDPPEKQKESALKAGYNKVYLKSEADKVIAHHKYKRCLAMAKWCYDRWIHAYHLNKIEKTRFYVRWQKCWLKLAEKFKDKEAK